MSLLLALDFDLDLPMLLLVFSVSGVFSLDIVLRVRLVGESGPSKLAFLVAGPALLHLRRCKLESAVGTRPMRLASAGVATRVLKHNAFFVGDAGTMAPAVRSVFLELLLELLVLEVVVSVDVSFSVMEGRLLDFDLDLLCDLPLPLSSLIVLDNLRLDFLIPLSSFIEVVSFRLDFPVLEEPSFFRLPLRFKSDDLLIELDLILAVVRDFLNEPQYSSGDIPIASSSLAVTLSFLLEDFRLVGDPLG